MVDYTKGTGVAGTMIIRDHGSSVEFLIKNASGSTFINHLRWTGTVNGVGVSGDKAVGTNSTVSLGAWGVGYSQNVTFNIPATGTSGLGGPTSFTQWINRQSSPPAPTTPVFSLLKHTSLRTTFSSRGDGGSPIREWRLLFGPDINGDGRPDNVYYTSSGTNDFTNLQPGRTYYAWARGRNDLGWGSWSGRGQGVTLAGVKIKANGEWKNAVPYVKDAGVWKPAIPFFKDNNTWKATKY